MRRANFVKVPRTTEDFFFFFFLFLIGFPSSCFCFVKLIFSVNIFSYVLIIPVAQFPHCIILLLRILRLDLISL